MKVVVVPSSTALEEMLDMFASTSPADALCARTLDVVYEQLWVDPLLVDSRYETHDLSGKLSGFRGTHLEQDAPRGMDKRRMVWRMLFKKTGFKGLDDARFPYVRERAGSLDDVDIIVHIFFGCFDYHDRVESDRRADIHDALDTSTTTVDMSGFSEALSELPGIHRGAPNNDALNEWVKSGVWELE